MRVLTTIKFIIKAVWSFMVIVPILFFWIAASQIFDSRYYTYLMEMREIAVNFFLMDMLVSLRQAGFSAVLVWIIGWVGYAIYRSAASKDKPANGEHKA